MNWQQLVIDIFERISQVLESALRDLTQEDLNQQPNPESNSMGWIVWHLTRVQDRAIADLAGEEQLWIKDKWHDSFARSADPQDVGVGHTLKDLEAFRAPEATTLLTYHHAVLKRTKTFLSNLSQVELDRKIDHPKFPTVGLRLTAIINDNFQHAGQVAYVRGLLKGKGWLDI